MNVFVAGGGRVGFHLARLLTIEGHDVTIIEIDPNRVEQADYALDARTITGNAVSVMLLTEAGVGAADVFVAALRTDELNLLAAATAKSLGAKQVVARVDDASYIESSMLYETLLNIDYILSPDALTAAEIARFIENPGMIAMEEFGRGLVQMRQVRVAKSPTRNGRTLRDVCPPGCGALLGTINRKGQTMVPNGSSVVEPGDLITLIGKRESIPTLQSQFQGHITKTDHITIMGGGSIGLHLAQLLDNRACSVKLIDWDMERCNFLAAKLKRVKVVCRDASSRSALEQEHIDEMDLFVATTSDDERNIMACVLAKEIGAAHSVAVVNQPDFAPLVGRLGIDHAVTPRACLSNRILRLIHQKNISTLAVLDEGQVEIIEFKVEAPAPLTGKSLRDIAGRFPKGALVATILRGEEVIVPSGESRIEVGDSVVMVAALDSIDAVLKLFTS